MNEIETKLVLGLGALLALGIFIFKFYILDKIS